MTAPLPGHTASNLSRVAAPPLLKVDNLSLEYRTAQRVVRATHQVSFEVDRTDRFVLLGPSGCGKSTLLRALAGLTPVDGGQVRVAGEDITWQAPQKRGIGMVFQSYALFPNMTVAENVAYGLKVRKVARADRGRRVRRW